MRALVFALVILLAGCSASLDDYQDQQPKFDLRNYLDGNIIAWGIVEDYRGKLTRRFCVDIVGTWQGNQGQLHETFYFADGEEQIRIWQLAIDEQGRVTGSAGDVDGEASGSEQGIAFNWRYYLDVPVGDSEYRFFIDDWLYRLDQERVMNRSYMKKFGLTLAEISIFFDKSRPDYRCSNST